LQNEKKKMLLIGPLVRLSCILLLTAVLTNAFTINIEFKLPKNTTDQNLIDLFKKITNVNATAIAQSPDKRIIRIDSLLISNKTIDLKNRIVVSNESDLIKRLIELAPYVYNLTNTSVPRTTIGWGWRRTTSTSTLAPFSEYDSTQVSEVLTTDYTTEFEDLSTKFEV